MFTNNQNNYAIYQSQNKIRWFTVLYDLAVNRFRYKTDLVSFNQKYFEKALINTGKAGLFYDDEIYTYLSLQATFNEFNIYQEPVNFTGIGYNYSKNFDNGAWCVDNYSDYCLIDIINQYANDLSNIDTTLYFLTKKLKQPYIFQVSNNQRLNADMLMNQIETSDYIKMSKSFEMDDVKLLNLNVNNTSIEQLQDVKVKRFNEILELIGVDTIANEKNERLTLNESIVNQDKINRFLSSAYQSRLDFCKRCKDLFNIDIQVEINKYNNVEINMYENESGIYQSDSVTETNINISKDM